MKLRVSRKKICSFRFNDAVLFSVLAYRARKATFVDDDGRRIFFCPVARHEGDFNADSRYRPLTDVLPFGEQSMRDGIKRLEKKDVLTVLRRGNRWDKGVLPSGKVQKKRTHRYHIPDDVLDVHFEELKTKGGYVAFEPRQAMEYGVVEAVILNLLELQSAKLRKKTHSPDVVTMTVAALAEKVGVSASTVRRALKVLEQKKAVERAGVCSYRLMNPATVKLKDSYTVPARVKPAVVEQTQETHALFDWKPSETLFVPTGITELDNRISSFGSGELAFLVGQTGHGKTITMLNFAIGAALAGFKPLIFSLEMSATDLRTRLFSNVCQLPCDKLRSGSVVGDVSKTALTAEEQRLIGNIRIVELRERASTALLAARVRELEQEGYCPDVVLVDQFSYLKANAPLSDDAADWKNQKKVADDLAEWAKASTGTGRSFSVWCLHQANGDPVLDYGRGSISGCKAVIEPASLVVGIGHNDLEPLKLRMFSLKTRHGSPFEITLPCDFSKMKVGRPAIDTLALTA